MQIQQQFSKQINSGEVINFQVPVVKKKKSNWWVWLILILAILGFGVYWFLR